MAVAKRQGRGKPAKIEQRKVKGRSEDQSEDYIYKLLKSNKALSNSYFFLMSLKNRSLKVPIKNFVMERY